MSCLVLGKVCRDDGRGAKQCRKICQCGRQPAQFLLGRRPDIGEVPRDLLDDFLRYEVVSFRIGRAS